MHLQLIVNNFTTSHIDQPKFIISATFQEYSFLCGLYLFSLGKIIRRHYFRTILLFVYVCACVYLQGVFVCLCVCLRKILVIFVLFSSHLYLHIKYPLSPRRSHSHHLKIFSFVVVYLFFFIRYRSMILDCYLWGRPSRPPLRQSQRS